MLHHIAPYFGYLASLLLILALLVGNDLQFRWFNTFGNVSFITYGIILQAFPVIITNVILLFINVYYLVKMYRRIEDFDIIEFTGEEKMAVKFLSFYEKDIHGYFPFFKAANLAGHLNFVILRDLVIANIFSAGLKTNGDAEVDLNFTLKKYRDYKVGRFLFDKEKQFLISKGVKRIVYRQLSSKNHENFLKVMGFSREMVDGTSCYVKQLF